MQTLSLVSVIFDDSSFHLSLDNLEPIRLVFAVDTGGGGGGEE